MKKNNRNKACTKGSVCPVNLPFINAITDRLNLRINIKDEVRLLAVYERYWLLNGVVSSIEGKERDYVFSLAKKHNSYIANYLG